MVRITPIIVAVCLLSGCEQPKPVEMKSVPPAEEPLRAPPTLWELSTNTSDLTGQITFVAANGAIAGKGRLIVRLAVRKLDCYLITDDFLETVDNMHDRLSPVKYKFDDGAIVRQSWIISNDNTSLFAGNALAFLQRMRKAKRFVIEYSPADVLPKTLTFDVSSFPQEIVNALHLK